MQSESFPNGASIAELLARVENLEAKLARLESNPRMDGPAVVQATPRHDFVGGERPGTEIRPTEPAARRHFLKLAGAAAVGTIALRPSSAAALDTDSLVIGSQSNLGASNTRLRRSYVATNTPDSVATFESQADVTPDPGGEPKGGDGIVGRGVGSKGAGVLGAAPGYGVRGESPSGYALFAGSNGRMGFDVFLQTSGPPTTGEYRAGDVILDVDGALWVCVAGNPGWVLNNAVGPATWRKLGGPTTAGQLHLLASPKRAYDSRAFNPSDRAASGFEGPLATGAPSRRVSLSLGWDGAANSTAVASGATGALFNLTITQTTGSGFLAVVPAGAAFSGSSTINWASANQTLALTTIAGVDSLQRIDVRCYAPGASTQFVVDVLGYFR